MATPRKRAAPATADTPMRTFAVQVYANNGDSVRLVNCRIRFPRGDFRDNIVFVGKESSEGIALLVGDLCYEKSPGRWTPYGFGCFQIDDMFMIRELFDLELKGDAKNDARNDAGQDGNS